MTTHNLKFNALPIQFYRSNFEVDTDSCDEWGCPSVVTEAEEQARLSNTW